MVDLMIVSISAVRGGRASPQGEWGMLAEHRLGGRSEVGSLCIVQGRGHAAVVGGESVHACNPCVTLVHMQRRVETVIVSA